MGSLVDCSVSDPPVIWVINLLMVRGGTIQTIDTIESEDEDKEAEGH